MTLLGRIRKLLTSTHRNSNEGGQGRILVVGDSHAVAFERAIAFTEKGSDFKQVEVLRFAKANGEIPFGSISFETFLKLAKSLDQRDHIFSVIGGNQYAVISTIQNPVDMEFLTGPHDREIHSDKAMLIPSRTISNYFYEALEGTLGKQLQALRAHTSASIWHLTPPPPKEDNDFIAKNFEKRFGEMGIGEYGPSRPELRLKAWKVQTAVLERLCSELGVKLVTPPAYTMTQAGFLDPQYYANDATHANRRYGREALKHILNLVSACAEISRERHRETHNRKRQAPDSQSRVHG